jgi:hypothetical protein
MLTTKTTNATTTRPHDHRRGKQIPHRTAMLSTTSPSMATTRDIIKSDAISVGLKTGALVTAVAGSTALAANTYWPAFRNRLGASGKTALVVSTGLASFVITTEKRLLAGSRNPEQYIASLDPNYVDVKLQRSSQLQLHHRLANFVYYHPYRSLVTVGVPLVGSIFAFQATNRSIQRSQQIMHTRIYGQGAVVVLLLASMGFHDYMRQRGGPFVAAGDDELDGE